MVERVTITIKKDILRRIDGMIDRREIRNRSHAIESLLAKSLSTGLNTALIMAGRGAGQPKPFIEVRGRPIIEHQIEMLRSYGITNIIIATDYAADKLRAYFGNGRAYGVRINYVVEDTPMGTAGAVAAASDYIEGSFIMLNVDTLMDPDINEIYEFHKKHRKLATVMLTTTDDTRHFGVVKMRGNQVLKFFEKPVSEPSRLINAGMCIFEKKVCDMVPKRKTMVEELFNRLCRQGQLMGFIHDGPVFDVGTKEGYERSKQHKM